MLTEIYDALKIKGEVDASFVRAALFGGHGWAIDWEMPGIAQVQDTPESTVSEAVNILDMYDMLERSYVGLEAEQKSEIDEWHVQFPGFDGNNETEHMGAARFFVETMGRFERFRGRDFNSHHPTLGRARAMLRVYEPLRAGTATRSGLPRLNADEIRQIVDAGRP
jgi:uncharacterized protein YfbU (UPF0304 family)